MKDPGRIESIDLLRGLIVAAMALDHTRDFFQPVGSVPEAFDTTSVAFFVTRWVSHFCAPGFIFLAGVAVALYRQRRPDRPALRFCLTRGLWLMLLEATWVSFSWYFHFEYTHLGVLWSIGGSMVLLAAVLWLPVRAVGVIGLTITVLLAAFPVPKDLPILGFLCQPNSIELMGHDFFQSYAIVPWFGVMAAGYGFADLLVGERSQRWLPAVGGVMLLAFGGLRALNGFGDPAQWMVQERGDWATVAHFLNPSKYPPSLMFQLLFLGMAVAALPLLARLKGPIADVVLAWGQVPMFFYLVHLPLIHVAGVVHAWLRYGETHIPATVDLSLSQIYLAWMVLLAALWPACVGWRRLKQAKRQWWWLSYL